MFDFTFNTNIDNLLSLIITKIFNNIFVINFSGTIEGISNADDFINKVKENLDENMEEDLTFSFSKKSKNIPNSRKSPKPKKFGLLSSSSYTIHTI